MGLGKLEIKIARLESSLLLSEKFSLSKKYIHRLPTVGSAETLVVNKNYERRNELTGLDVTHYIQMIKFTCKRPAFNKYF